METRDDLGARVELARVPQRVVSLVPSLTEALAASCPDRLPGATTWCTHPAWLGEAADRWAGPTPAMHTRVVVPIWRDPWMVVGHPTFTADLLARAGYAVCSPGPGRYPKAELAALDDEDLADLVLLPDEPYVFTERDGPGAFQTLPTRLVSGRLLTWYGPALVEAANWAGR